MARVTGCRKPTKRLVSKTASGMGLRLGFYGFRVQALRAKGLIRATHPDTASAGVEDLVTALSVAAALGMRTELAHCHAAFAWARTPDMSQHINEARRLYGMLRMTGWCEHLLNMAESNRRIYC
jgi:hypothetical protein